MWAQLPLALHGLIRWPGRQEPRAAIPHPAGVSRQGIAGSAANDDLWGDAGRHTCLFKRGQEQDVSFACKLWRTCSDRLHHVRLQFVDFNSLTSISRLRSVDFNQSTSISSIQSAELNQPDPGPGMGQQPRSDPSAALSSAPCAPPFAAGCSIWPPTCPPWWRTLTISSTACNPCWLRSRTRWGLLKNDSCASLG